MGDHRVGDSACIDSPAEDSWQRKRGISGDGCYIGYHVGGGLIPLKWSLNCFFDTVFLDKPF